MNELRVRELLHDQPAPDEVTAEERAWRIVLAGLADAPQRARRPRRRLAMALAAAALLLVLALTGPGAAVADWVRDAIGRDHVRTLPLTSLPAPGRLLVQSGQGPWIVSADGSKRRLGGYEEASWSPHGLFVAATRPNELLALDPKGGVRWSLARRGGVHAPRWSPDGFRIAYLSGDSIRVVAGDGTGDRRLGRAGKAAPAWQPGGKIHGVAYVDPAGAIRVVNADSGPPLWRSAEGLAPTELGWSADGGTLLALSPDRLRLFDAGGRLLASHPLPAGDRAQTAAFAPSGGSVALVSRNNAGTRSRVTLIHADRGRLIERRLVSGAGRFGNLAWSPDGEWLLVAWPTADQWMFLRVPSEAGPPRKVVTSSGIGEQFDPGGLGTSSPAPAGWCCRR